jgi:hypothetical protein
MGLDISFDRKQAIAAGMQFVDATNGSAMCIQDAIDNECDADYITWLQESTRFVTIPNLGLLRTDDGNADTVIIRANKWGNAYTPLTQWLAENNIEWNESV